MYGFERIQIINKHEITPEILCACCDLVMFNPVMCKKCRKHFSYQCIKDSTDR